MRERPKTAAYPKLAALSGKLWMEGERGSWMLLWLVWAPAEEEISVMPAADDEVAIKSS